MQICHFSDSHLGAGEGQGDRGATGLTIRQEDMINAFREAVDKIIEIKPDLCIHSGDLFHTVRPLNSIIAIAAVEFHRLAEENNIPTIMIAGNHDAPKQPHVGAAVDIFRQIDNLKIVSNGRLEIINIGPAVVYALPHCLTTQEQATELEKLPLDPSGQPSLLIAHGVAAGMPEFSMIDIREQELPLEILNRFDYTALGHYHNWCQVSANSWYSGSTERLSQAERGSEKGFLKVNTDPLNVEFIAVSSRAMVDLGKIDATGKRGDELVAELKILIDKTDSKENIVKVNFTGLTEETLKTIPSKEIAEIKRAAFDLKIKFERADNEDDSPLLGRSTLGQIDKGFIEFLKEYKLNGFDRERLIKEALKYLSD